MGDWSVRSLIQDGSVNFGRQSDDYSNHRPGFPPSFYDRLAHIVAHHFGRPHFRWDSLRVLDIGTGPGIVALELAQRGATVVGVDIAEGQIVAAVKAAEARKLASRCTFLVATAEETKQESSSFDLVTAGQCWPWFEHAKAMKEMRRVLKPGGLLVVGQFCYLPKISELAGDSEGLVLKHNPAWSLAGFNGIYPSQIDQLVNEGKFDLIDQFCYDHKQVFTHEAWRGRMRTCNGVGSSNLTPKQISEFDKDLEELLKKKYPNPVMVLHRIWAVVVAKQKEEEGIKSKL